MKTLRAALAIVVGAGMAVGARQAAPSAAELARALQARYAKIQSFTADFTQTLKSYGLRERAAEKGTVRVHKPGRMRWTYATRNELVSDGVMVYWFVPADKTVTVTKMPGEHEAGTALLFLAGRGDLIRDFTPSLAANPPAGEWRLDLKPRTPQTDFTKLTLIVSRDTLDLRGFSTVDDQDTTSTIMFSRLRENVTLPDSDFVFVVPKGIDVIQK